jgi:hypothetical protein
MPAIGYLLCSKSWSGNASDLKSHRTASAAMPRLPGHLFSLRRFNLDRRKRYSNRVSG